MAKFIGYFRWKITHRKYIRDQDGRLISIGSNDYFHTIGYDAQDAFDRARAVLQNSPDDVIIDWERQERLLGVAPGPNLITHPPIRPIEITE